jgi:cytochrome P450
MTPAVPWVLSRIVPKGGAVLADRYFPAGTLVGCSPYVIHRCELAYGPDPGVFRPERWLEASDDERKVLERNNLAVS